MLAQDADSLVILNGTFRRQGKLPQFNVLLLYRIKLILCKSSCLIKRVVLASMFGFRMRQVCYVPALQQLFPFQIDANHSCLEYDQADASVKNYRILNEHMLVL